VIVSYIYILTIVSYLRKMSAASTEQTMPSMATTTTSPTASSSSSHPKPQPMMATDRQIAEARAALEASMHNIGSHFDSTLKSRATNLHANNAILDKQIAELQDSTKSLAKETDKLKKVADDAARKLKELGNVQNWAEVMEREFLILEETVRLADESEEEEDYGPCRVCGMRVEESGDELLWCRACEGEFHTGCVGLEGVPGREWHCAECAQQGTYLQSVKTADMVQNRNENGLDEVMAVTTAVEVQQDLEMVNGHSAEMSIKSTETGIGMPNGCEAELNGKNTKVSEVELGASNGEDVEMGGVEHDEKGKDKETVPEEADQGVAGSASTITMGGSSSLNHLSTTLSG
jgi:hypothetical protein